MSVEIEAKMKLEEMAGLEARLLELGATRGPVLHEVNTFFDTRSGSLKSTDQGLRVRAEKVELAPAGAGGTGGTEGTGGADGVVVTVTHKGPRSHGRLKSRAETELRVADEKAAAALLGALGFAPVLTFEKRRRRWTLDGCHVDIDTLPYLGHYVEIEGPSEPEVLTLRDRLALTELPMIRASYIALVMDYLAVHHITATYVPLEDGGA